MLSAMAEAILRVDNGSFTTCQQYIQEIWYNTRAASVITTAEGTEWFHEDVAVALNTFSQYIPQLGAVAEIHCRAATWEDINDMVSLGCDEDRVSWVVEKLASQWLDNTERHIVRLNCDFWMMKMMTILMAIR